MEDEESLHSMWKKRVKQAKELEKTVATLKVDGAKKMANRIASEIRFLLKVEHSVEKAFVDASNIGHLADIVSAIHRHPTTSILCTFSIPMANDVVKHTVDLVSSDGGVWVKVLSRSCRGLALDWLTGMQRSVVQQANTYLEMASYFPHNFQPPEILFDFVHGVPDKVATKLRKMGVRVVGVEIPLDSLCNAPEDLVDDLMEMEYGTDCPIGRTLSEAPPINLDVSTVFVLISNLTHPDGTKHKFNSRLLTEQAKMEEAIPARTDLLDKIHRRQWIMCRTAKEAVDAIVATVGGNTEKRRWSELLPLIRVVDDVISPRAMELADTGKVNERAQAIFGTGDALMAITATANKHFVQSAFHQGVKFAVLIHESRALSEQKELPLESKSLFS